MSDMIDTFRAMKDERRARRQAASIRNVLAIGSSGIACEYRRAENVYLFREQGKPSCDFYPASGKWKVNGQKVAWKYGGGESFINWYRKQ
jgi:hypothetical protein